MSPELIDPGRLGRRVQFDERSRNFQVRTLLREQDVPRQPRSRGWSAGPQEPLDQLSEGACVGAALVHRRGGHPTAVPGLTMADARSLYLNAQRIDPWPGGAYPGASPFYEGTSVLAGLKVGQRLGWWSSYWWIGAGSGDVERDLVDTLSHVGTVVFGSVWLRSMFSPRASGLLEVDPSSGEVGGHAYLACGIRLNARLRGEKAGSNRTIIVCRNSWGPYWGAAAYASRPDDHSFFYLNLDDALWLLSSAQDGEAAVPVETGRVP